MKEQETKNIFKKDTLLRELEKKEKKAKKLLEKTEGFEQVLVHINLKITKSIKRLHEAVDDLKLLFELVKDVITLRYTDLPLGSLLAVIGALLYFLAPLDIAPDFLPAIGFTDDIAVIVLVIKQVQADLVKYKKWVKEKKK
ncbi:MAG: DUF1232 domain-containing protein [Spirochaetales bacterium]|nr:DUF1232 domain-containing protein [Spirochaetales bacterium]